MTALERATRVGQAVAAILVLLGCAVAFMPLAPSFPGATLDSAWIFAVNAAVAQRLVFGRDLVFTFGPYASVDTLNYHPATDRIVMAASLVLTLAVAAGLIVLTTGWRRWAAVALAIALCLPWLRDPLFFMAPLILLALTAQVAAARGPVPSPLLAAGALLVVAMALLPLVKGTFAAAAVVALGLGGLLLLIRGRWPLVCGGAILFLGAMALFWVGAHQPLSHLPGYFIAQSHIVAGYTEAMAIPGPAWHLGVYLAAALAIVAFNAPAARRSGLPGVVLLTGAAALLLLAFKAGLVRQDEHVVIAAGALAMIAGLLAVLNRGAAPLLGLLAGLAGWAVLESEVEKLGPRAAAMRVEAAYRQATIGLLDRLQGGPALHRRFDEALAQIRADRPLPPITGSTDIYSIGQAVLLAHGLPWAPRPVLQSYSAYSPALAQDDARHLEGDAAPDNLLVALEPIDERLPALEDGLSWLPMLGRYEGVAMLGNTALLHRLSGPAATVLLGPRPAAATHGLGEMVPLDAARDAPLWAEIDVQPTLIGRVLSAAFKPPLLRIAIHLVNGATHDFRYVSGMGQAGFLISPLVANAAELMALQLPGLGFFDDERVASFAIIGDPRFWRSRYSLTLRELHIPAQPGLRRVLFVAPQPAPAVVNADGTAQCGLEGLNGTMVDHTKPATLPGMVRLTGWGFARAEPLEEPDSVAISLQSADGQVLQAPALLQSRPAAGPYFHPPHLRHIGFEALLDLHEMAGPYRLGLEITQGARHWHCGLVDPVEITPQ